MAYAEGADAAPNCCRIPFSVWYWSHQWRDDASTLSNLCALALFWAMPRHLTWALTGHAFIRCYFGDGASHSALSPVPALSWANPGLCRTLIRTRLVSWSRLKNRGSGVNMPPWGWNGVAWPKSSTGRSQNIYSIWTSVLYKPLIWSTQGVTLGVSKAA